MEEAILPQILIICPQTCYLKAHLGVTIPTPATAVLELFFDNLQSGNSLWIKEEIDRSDLKNTETSSQAWWGLWGSSILYWHSCCWKASSMYELFWLLAGSYLDFHHDFHSLAVLGGKSSWLYLATISFFPNPSLETVLKSFPAGDEVPCYPTVSLGPCTWDCALNKDLLLPWICQLFYRITKPWSTERH